MGRKARYVMKESLALHWQNTSRGRDRSLRLVFEHPALGLRRQREEAAEHPGRRAAAENADVGLGHRASSVHQSGERGRRPAERRVRPSGVPRSRMIASRSTFAMNGSSLSTRPIVVRTPFARTGSSMVRNERSSDAAREARIVRRRTRGPAADDLVAAISPGAVSCGQKDN